MKRMEMESTISNLTMEGEMRKKEKESLEASVKDMKKEIGDLRAKIKAAEQERSTMSASESDREKTVADLTNSVEQLKGELADKDSAIMEHDLNM